MSKILDLTIGSVLGIVIAKILDSEGLKKPCGCPDHQQTHECSECPECPNGPEVPAHEVPYRIIHDSQGPLHTLRFNLAQRDFGEFNSTDEGNEEVRAQWNSLTTYTKDRIMYLLSDGKRPLTQQEMNDSLSDESLRFNYINGLAVEFSYEFKDNDNHGRVIVEKINAIRNMLFEGYPIFGGVEFTSILNPKG